MCIAGWPEVLYTPPKLTAENIHLYLDDGVHLSEQGSDLQQGLRVALGLEGGRPKTKA